MISLDLNPELWILSYHLALPLWLLSIDLFSTTDKWLGPTENYVAILRNNTTKEAQSVILILNIITDGNSLNLLYMKVGFLGKKLF